MGIRKSGRSAVAAIAAMLSGASSVVGAAGWRMVASDQFDTRLTFAERWRCRLPLCSTEEKPAYSR